MHLYIAVLVLALSFTQAIAGSPLHSSRTIYKCEDGNKVVYSDAPCLGATKLDITPTRGLNKSTGRELIGSDIRNEIRREQMADALRPLTGLSPERLAQLSRRTSLPTAAQQECKQLDEAIPLAEQLERTALGTKELKPAQLKLFNLRKRFHDLKCE